MILVSLGNVLSLLRRVTLERRIPQSGNQNEFMPISSPSCIFNANHFSMGRWISRLDSHIVAGRNYAALRPRFRINKDTTDGQTSFRQTLLKKIDFSLKGLPADPRIARNMSGLIGLGGKVFENHIKSLIQHCERSELRLHFEWTKVD